MKKRLILLVAIVVLAVLLAGLGVFIRMRLNKVAEKYYCAG